MPYGVRGPAARRRLLVADNAGIGAEEIKAYSILAQQLPEPDRVVRNRLDVESADAMEISTFKRD